MCTAWCGVPNHSYLGGGRAQLEQHNYDATGPLRRNYAVAARIDCRVSLHTRGTRGPKAKPTSGASALGGFCNQISVIYQ